jgi:hydroxyethylthiazole kinase
MTSLSSDKIFHDLNLLKQVNPLVHNITNLVVMQTTANMLLAIGASPLMAHAPEELAEIVAIAQALVINMGTLDQSWTESVKIAQALAIKKNIPIIFDPVGAGASRYRTETAKSILSTGVQILRGNASEIMALVDTEKKAGNTKGVDATHDSIDALSAAKILSQQYHCIVVVSGKTDIVVDAASDRQIFINHGAFLFTKVTGMGCSATALIAAFAAVNPDYFLAAAHAMIVFGRAGEIAEKKSQGCGSFSIALLDALYAFQSSDLVTLDI